MKSAILLFALSISIISCYKEPAPEPKETFSVAYSAKCADCDIYYTLPNGQWDTVYSTGQFMSDTFVFQEGNWAYLYAYSRTSDSPEEINIFSPGDTSIHWTKTQHSSQNFLKLAWYVGYP